jgi:hypothetical protein
VLDILRRVVLIASAAEHYARTAGPAGSGGSVGRVLELLADDSAGLGAVLMGVRFLANCFHHHTTRKILVSHATVPYHSVPTPRVQEQWRCFRDLVTQMECVQAMRLVGKHRGHENKQVRLAVATFLLKYVPPCARTCAEPKPTLLLLVLVVHM